MALELAAGRTAASPELGLGATRRLQALMIERSAVLARADDQHIAPPNDLEPGPRAVIAHRNTWFRSKVAVRLAEHGIQVVASVDDGASAFAAVLLDQPDLLLVESPLPLLRGSDVLARARQFAPGTLVGAQAVGPYQLRMFIDAGARAVFTRSIPPPDVADELAACLFDSGRVDVGGDGVGATRAERPRPVGKQLLAGARRPAQVTGRPAPRDEIPASRVGGLLISPYRPASDIGAGER